MGVQNLSQSVKICQSYWRKFAATFLLCPTVYVHGQQLTAAACNFIVVTTMHAK